MNKRKLVLQRVKLRDLAQELDRNLEHLIHCEIDYAFHANLTLIKLNKRIARLQEELHHIIANPNG
jgi:hypothetical protein